MTHRLIRLIAALALASLAAPLAAEAQQATKVYRIGFLYPSPPLPEPPTLEAFRQGLRDLVYVEGQNLIIKVVLTPRTPSARAACSSPTVVCACAGWLHHQRPLCIIGPPR